MADVEKALGTSGGRRDGDVTDERSRISDDSSHDPEKRDDFEKSDLTTTDGVEDHGRDNSSNTTPSTLIVDWDGPDDPEFPQNL